MATTLKNEETGRRLLRQTDKKFSHTHPPDLVLYEPLEVGAVHGLIADGTLGPGLVAQRQVVQHARPAVDVTAAGDVSSHRRVQADGTGRNLVAVDALWER